MASFLQKMPVFEEIVNFANRAAVFAAGSSKRDYEPLFEDDSVIVSKHEFSVKELAKKYAPVLYVDARLGNMRPLRILFDAVHDSENLMLINYFVCWPDELHPNPLAHLAYRELPAFCTIKARIREEFCYGLHGFMKEEKMSC